MALTPSTMLPLGTLAPTFNLPSTENKLVPLSSSSGKSGTLVIFMCNHCPYVKHIRTELAAITTEYAKKGIAVFGINSNDVKNYPEDSPEMMKKEKEEAHYTFPYLYDETQAIAKAYQAACTPDFFLFDIEHKLVYRGQFDESRPGNKLAVTGQDLKEAMDALLSGKAIQRDQTPSIGCNIKWKS